MVSEGQFVGLDWNRIARLHSQVLVSIVLLTRKCLNDSVPSYPKITIFILMPLYKRFRQDAVMTFVFRNSN